MAPWIGIVVMGITDTSLKDSRPPFLLLPTRVCPCAALYREAV